MKKAIAIIFSVVLLGAVMFFLSYAAIFAHVFGETYRLDVSYKSALPDLKGNLHYKDLSLMSKDTGVGIMAHSADVFPHYSSGGVTLVFRFKDVGLLKKGKEDPVNYDSLPGLVASPLNSKWKYVEVNGEATLTDKMAKVKDLKVAGDEIKLTLKGDFQYDGVVDTDMKIWFSDKLTKQIPPEMIGLILANDNSGWKTLSVRLTGDLNKPAIQVSSKLFRLNIKALNPEGAS